MVTEEITIRGMHCDACEKTIKRSLGKIGVTVDDISYRNGRARITYGDVSQHTINRALSDKGYALDDSPPEEMLGNLHPSRMRAQEIQREKQQAAFSTEKKILSDGFLMLGLLLVVQAVLALGVYSMFSGYESKYLPALLYLPVAIIANVIVLQQHQAYKGSVSCMTGMMIGMTLGMSTGFMVGGIVGITNGMFTGSVVGTIAGIIVGVWGGKCCGTMGVMEGMMAGLMSGTMGAMLTVMLVTDHVWWFMPFMFAICIAFLVGIMHVIVQEHEGEDIEVRPWPMTNVLAACFAAMLVISAIIILAPKGLY